MYSYFFHLSAYKRSNDPEWEVFRWLGFLRLVIHMAGSPKRLEGLKESSPAVLRTYFLILFIYSYAE